MINCLNWLRVLVFGSGSSRVSLLIELFKAQKKRGRKRLAAMVLRYIERAYGLYIGVNTTIGSDVKFPHPTGIVIGDGVVVGDGSIIYQNVTLGGARVGDAALQNYPVVGKGVTIFAGAVVIGKINVGDNSTIGANCVVLKDIPEESIAVGIPARILNEDN